MSESEGAVPEKSSDVVIHAMQMTACMGVEKAAIALVGVTLVNLASTFIGRKSSGK